MCCISVNVDNVWKDEVHIWLVRGSDDLWWHLGDFSLLHTSHIWCVVLGDRNCEHKWQADTYLGQKSV